MGRAGRLARLQAGRGHGRRRRDGHHVPGRPADPAAPPPDQRARVRGDPHRRQGPAAVAAGDAAAGPVHHLRIGRPYGRPRDGAADELGPAHRHAARRRRRLYRRRPAAVQGAPVHGHDPVRDLPVHAAGACVERLCLARLPGPRLAAGAQPLNAITAQGESDACHRQRRGTARRRYRTRAGPSSRRCQSRQDGDDLCHPAPAGTRRGWPHRPGRSRPGRRRARHGAAGTRGRHPRA
ncbi:protein of unknown function (plasmid) [Cupriavidus taiwanensis]|uniref:Uncharacterized protein n=1 Tax=Cupriavidus taiwanensis TaxID=164546 RepID=A0A9Q7UX36_9BURK|nr:protein of unknown function [Cupriavidus taiwanensis]